jgi:hypothetical protein
MLSTAVAVIVMAAATAAGTPGIGTPGAGSGQLALAPVPGANGQARSYFTLAVPPGGSARDTLLVSNPGSTTEKLTVGVSDGITASNSGSAYGPVSASCTGPACWVSGVPRTITLQPHERQAIEFRVAVPSGTAPGQYLAGITAEPAARPRPTPIKSGAHGAQIVIVNTVTVGVAVTVGQVSELRTQLAVAGVSADYMQSLVRLNVATRNTGQRFTRGTGRLNCTMGGTRTTYPVSMDTVLPGDTAELAVNGTGMHTGMWQCTVAIKDSAGGTATWSGKVTVPNAQPAATKRVGNNSYTVPPSEGIPAWAIALFVLAGLILLSLWALILRRNRNNNLNNPNGT